MTIKQFQEYVIEFIQEQKLVNQRQEETNKKQEFFNQQQLEFNKMIIQSVLVRKSNYMDLFQLIYH